MKKIIALLALTCLCTSVNASTIYSFTVDSGSNVGSGFLDTDETGLATSGSLTMTSGSIIGEYSLFSNVPTSKLSPFGKFLYNNMTYNGSSLELDWYGLLFTGNGLEINIWGNGEGNPNSFWASNGTSYIVRSNLASFTAAQPLPASVPVPAAIWLFGPVLMGLVGMFKRKQGMPLVA
jgi:hypothetical protein